MKGSSSRMKNKMGAQKGALIKMKQEKTYIYQWLFAVCYVPIIAPSFLVKSSGYCFVFFNTNVHFCALWVWQNCGRYRRDCLWRNAKVCLQHMLPCRSRLSCFLSSIATLMASGYGCCPSSSLPARMGRKDVTAKTYIQTRLVDHFDICIHLTTHLRFTWSSLTKKCIQYPAIDRQL